MKPSARIRIWVSLLALAMFFAFDRSALAGTLEVRDDAHVLLPADGARLRSLVQASPFDARLVLTTKFQDGPTLSRYVGSLINAGNMIAVGLDPQHRHVEVHFGTASGISQTAWADIERAGNDEFGHGDWAGGIDAIIRAASASASPHSGGVAPARSLVAPVTGILMAAGVIGLLVFLARRIGSPGPYGVNNPGYGAPQPWGSNGPYGPQQRGMGPMGGGLIGAGLGGLVGYELGKMEGEREVGGHGRDASFDAPGRDDFDAGGGGSSWDDSGGGFDGGSSDGGGGGGDF